MSPNVTLGFYSQLITEAAHGMNQIWPLKGLVDLGSQIANIDLNCIGENVGIVVPDVSDQVLFGQDSVLITQEVLEERVLLARETARPACPRDLIGNGIKAPIIDRQNVTNLVLRPA